MRGQTKSVILTSCALVFRRQSRTNTIAPAANALATDRTSKMCRRQANPKSRVLPQSNVKPVKRLQPQHEKSFTALPNGATLNNAPTSPFSIPNVPFINFDPMSLAELPELVLERNAFVVFLLV